MYFNIVSLNECYYFISRSQLSIYLLNMEKSQTNLNTAINELEEREEHTETEIEQIERDAIQFKNVDDAYEKIKGNSRFTWF